MLANKIGSVFPGAVRRLAFAQNCVPAISPSRRSIFLKESCASVRFFPCSQNHLSTMAKQKKRSQSTVKQPMENAELEGVATDSGTIFADELVTPHAELFNLRNVCIHECFDQSGLPISIEWRCGPVIFSNSTPPPSHSYTLRVTRDGGANASMPYSLYNLGAQGRRWEVVIKSITGRRVRILEQQKNAAQKYELRPVNMGGNAGYDVTGVDVAANCTVARVQKKQASDPDASLVMFLQFEGSVCEIAVESRRPLSNRRRLKPKGIGPFSEHDSVPPPPEPGGDEGEEE